MKKIIPLALLVIASCSSQPLREPGSVPEAPKMEGIDTALGEELEPNEDASIQKVFDEAMVALRRDFRPPNVPRDAHAKSHGCLTASFTVNNKNLPPELRVGLFSENKSYPSWVRFSNNTSDPMSHDKDLDLRGIAVKVMNVPGKKLIPREADAQTQDFLMFASPIFFIKDIKDYSEFIKALSAGRALSDLTQRPRALVQLATAQLKARTKKNPLKLTYFSASPYRLGAASDPSRRPVKYSFKPCDAAVAASYMSGNSADRDFMREAMKQTLLTQNACFAFQVQVGDQTKPSVYPVEDPSVLWPADKSPYRTVAVLRIPKQNFDTTERDEFCEHLSFTPWHALPEHKPLGRTNRMRLKVYENISRYRHQANGVERREPRTLDPKTAY